MIYEQLKPVPKQDISALGWSKMALYNLRMPIIKLSILAFAILAFCMVALPNMVSAATTNSTYYVPLHGYYLNPDGTPYTGSATQFSCNAGVCTPLNTAANIANNPTIPTYTNCNTQYCKYYGSNYPYKTYEPYTKTTGTYANGQQGPIGSGYQYVSYPYQTYTPYEKTGPNTYKSGSTKTVPYYPFNVDGTPTSQIANGNTVYGIQNGANTFVSPPYASTGGFYQSNGQANNQTGRGFVMSNQGF